MGALTYLLKRTCINYFKRLKQKPQKMVGPLFILIWFSFMFFPGNKSGTIKTQPDIFISVFMIIVIMSFIYSLYKGTKSINSRFDMCDVNLIFTSPIRPQTVLIYGVIKQIALELLTSFYIVYQIPNFLRDFKVPIINQVFLIIAFLVFQFVFCNVVKLLIFALNTKYKMIGPIIRSAVKALCLAFVAVFILLIIRGNFIEQLKLIAKAITYDSWIKFIPVIGWMREIVFQSITGMGIASQIYMLLTILLSSVMLYIIYKLELDFYEDMLTSAENNDTIKNYKRDKGSNVVKKQNFLNKPLKTVKLNLKGVYGGKVIFFKHMNEYFKRSFLFFINLYSIVLLLVSIILSIYAKDMNIKLILMTALLLLFFTAGFGGKIYTEIGNSFIFLLPDKPKTKLLYGILSSLIKIFTDSLLLFLPFGIMSKTSLYEIVLCVICYVTLGGMLSYSGLLAFRIGEFLGFSGAVAQGILFLFFQLLLIVPFVILVFVCTQGLTSMEGDLLYWAIIIYSSLLGFLFSFGCIGILRDMEFSDRL